MENLAAHIVMVQEHKLLDDEAIAEAQQWCLKHNWVGLFGKAAKGPKGKPAGGTAVLVKQGFDLGLLSPAMVAHDRLTAARVEVPGWGIVLCGSAYFQVGTGLGATNLELLAAMGGALDQHRGIAIFGGDFNMGPSTLRASGFPLRAGLTLVVPAQPTCITKSSRSVIDFS